MKRFLIFAAAPVALLTLSTVLAVAGGQPEPRTITSAEEQCRSTVFIDYSAGRLDGGNGRLAETLEACKI